MGIATLRLIFAIHQNQGKPMQHLSTWLEIAPDSDFSIHNFPFGIGSRAVELKFAASRIGDWVINLHELNQAGLFEGIELPDGIFARGQLNEFIALGKGITGQVRLRLQEELSRPESRLAGSQELQKKALHPAHTVQMHLPVHIPNYTDFYSSLEHATNVGTMFRGPDNALMPNWKHMPIGYHGRASSIIPSGVNIHRPNGQRKAPTDEQPSFGPSKKLDFELEMAFIVGKPSELGHPIRVNEADDYIFGFVLFNDWSARDIQQWEYVPLGPFLGKNFASSISPWIVTTEALAFARVPGPTQAPAPMDYLKQRGVNNFAIHLEVALETENGVTQKLVESNFRYMYWSVNQQLAHHTVNGCNVQVGDMYASGTISGPEKNNFGSMLELTWNGKEPISLPDGSSRSFIEDGDTVTMRGYAEKEGIRVGFGEVRSKVLPALAYQFDGEI